MNDLRRDFLKSSLFVGGSLLFPSSFVWAQGRSKYLTSAIRQLDGNYGLAIVDMKTRDYKVISLKHRCHSMCFSKINEEILFFDRRPGEYIYVVDGASANIRKTIVSPNDRRFYGHGCFSVDEKKLYVPANNLETLDGVVLVYDVVNDYSLIGEFSSGGIGPHEIVRHPLKDILYICNGGLKTHPDSGREILNLETMSSNLTVISLEAPQLQETFLIQSSKLSLRHIDINSNGDAVIGVQDKDFFPDENKSLVAFYSANNKTLEVEEVSGMVFTEVSGYVASVAVDSNSHYAVSTCPKGDIVILWNFKEKRIIEIYDFKEASGACFDSERNEFIVTSGQGHVIKIKNEKVEEFQKFPFQWDNHAELF